MSLVATICVLGILLTVMAVFAAARVERNTEERLLEVQTAQAASVLAAAITAIEAPLATALEVDRASDSRTSGDRAVTRLLSPQVGPEAMFVAAGLWRTAGNGLTEAVRIGGSPGLEPVGAGFRAFLDRALAADTTVVRRVDDGAGTRLGYALADRSTRAVVYVERVIPSDRRAPADRDSAFTGLDYAIYLGPTTRTSAMTTTNVDPSTLPLSRDVTFTSRVPFCDTVLTLVTSPRDHLGSPLGQRLPILLLIGGLLITLAAALSAGKLARARSKAETDTATIKTLYEQVDTLYDDQRELFVGLQRALLPHADPHIPHIQVAAEYVAGAIGIDIGGDWYSVIRLDEDRFAFVVGDVSGRGVEAVAEMARARFTLRAYLVEGHSPSAALAMCSRQFDVIADGHIVTALVGIGNHHTGELVFANAGHPPPLLASQTTTQLISIPVGPPLGLGASTYDEATSTMTPGSTLLCYTDGLIERRGEDIDVGLERLASTVTPSADLPLHDLVALILDALGDDGAPDDTAILALRRESSVDDGPDDADRSPASEVPVALTGTARSTR